jgi:2,5-furandicarboxylate decarboxylase 1
MIPTRWSQLRAAMRAAGIQVKDMNVTLGGAGSWHVVISIRKQSGEGKNALMAALSVMDLKHVVVVDDDIDVFNAMDVEWAIATRVQADRDVFIVPGARAKPLDPSLPVMPPGVVPTGAKVGIDATIGEGIPVERFERIAYAYADRAKIDDYVAGKADPAPGTVNASAGKIADLAQQIHALIEEAPKYYSEIAEQFSDYDFQSIARALGKLHADENLWQDPRGRMCIRGSKFAAKPPVKA